jgi:hypothetical protein
VTSGLKAYFELISREHDCYGTWMPGTPVALGDIGRISRNGSFERTGSLETRDTMPAARAQSEPDQTIATSGGVTFSAGGSVKADNVVEMLASAGATIDIAFARAGAAAMLLEDVTRHEFVDEQPVRAAMSRLLEAGRIDEDEVVVTYVKEAASGVIATTYDAQTGGDVDVNAALGSGVLTVAKVGGHLGVTSAKQSQTVVTAEPGKPLTPMYRALVFRRNRNWWSFWRSQIEIGSALPSRSFESADPGPIAASRPSMANAPAP